MAGFRLRGKEKSLCRRRPVCVFGTKAHASAVPPKLTASLPPALRRTIMRPPLGNGGISVVTTGPKAVRSALPGPFGRSLSPARTTRRLSVDNGGCLLLRVIGLCVWFSVWNEAIISALFPFVKLFFQLFSMNIFLADFRINIHRVLTKGISSAKMSSSMSGRSGPGCLGCMGVLLSCGIVHSMPPGAARFPGHGKVYAPPRRAMPLPTPKKEKANGRRSPSAVCPFHQSET